MQWSVPGPLCKHCGCYVGVFLGFITGSDVYLTHLTAFGTFSFVQTQSEGFLPCLNIFSFVMFA